MPKYTQLPIIALFEVPDFFNIVLLKFNSKWSIKSRNYR